MALNIDALLYHYFSALSQSNNILIPSWHVSKISVAVAVDILHSQPFSKSSFHFFIIVDSVTYQLLLQLPENESSMGLDQDSRFIYQCFPTFVAWMNP
jgi:hypothetical protein